MGKIITKKDKFLESAEMSNLQPLNAGTGYAANVLVSLIPDLDEKVAWKKVGLSAQAFASLSTY